jgi:hypothetical protein
VVVHFKPFFSRHVLLKRFYSFVLKFNDSAALRADQVIVVARAVLIFETGKTVGKTALLGKTGVR